MSFLSLLPLEILAGGIFLGLLVLAAARRTAPVFAVALVTLAASLVAALAGTGGEVAGLLSFQPFVLFTLALADGATIFVALSSWGYFKGRGEEHGEYYLLLLLATLGAGVLAAASAFATLFVGLELLSVALFPLIAWRRAQPAASEAAIKYLVLSGASSAFLLFGMALAYAGSGSMEFATLARVSGALGPVGFAMMVVGIGFKLAVVPFHFWTPDIYDGASAPAAGFIATVSKGAMLVLLARLYVPGVLGTSAAYQWIFGVIAAATMFVGNLLALRERNIKRILAYSSIAHLGYLVFAFVAGGAPAVRAIAFYLLAYFAMTLGAFAVVAELSIGHEQDVDNLEAYRGLALRRPWLAGIFVVMLVSLTGLPLTAGFIGKLVILTAGEGALLWALAVILAVNTTISLFYYFRVVSAMFRPAEIAVTPSGLGARAAVAAVAGPARSGAPAVSVAAGLGMVVLTILVIALGIYPTPVLELIARFAQ